MQIKNQVFHALFLQLVEGIGKLLSGGSGKAVHTDVTDFSFYHVRSVEAVHGNLIALDGERQQFLHTGTQHFYRHRGAFRSAQAAHHFVRIHFHAGNNRVVHFDDAVAGQDTNFLGRPSRHGLNDKEGVGGHIKLDTDAVEISLKGFVEPLHFFRIGIGGMRVEFFQHADNGGFHQFVFVYLIYIEIGDGELGQLQLARRRIEQLVLGRQGSPCRTSCQ